MMFCVRVRKPSWVISFQAALHQEDQQAHSLRPLFRVYFFQWGSCSAWGRGGVHLRGWQGLAGWVLLGVRTAGWLLFLFCFYIEISSTHYKTHSFEVYSSVAFSVFAGLCSRRHCLVQNPPKDTLLVTSHPQALAATPLLSVDAHILHFVEMPQERYIRVSLVGKKWKLPPHLIRNG